MHPDSVISNNQPKIKSEIIDDVRLTYLDYEGPGLPLMFLHATGFLPWTWHPIARKLTSSFHSLAPYFCDHRDADPETGGMRWMTLARDLASLCNHLGIENGFYVGHSMGATILTMAAALFELKAKAIILIEPIYLPRDFYHKAITVEEHPLASKSLKRRNDWRDAAEARQYLESRDLFKRWDDEALDLYIQYGLSKQETGRLQLSCSPQREASLFMGGVHDDPWPLLPNIECPVLVVEGEMSGNRQMIDLKKAASLMPQGSYRLVENSGHLVPMENPDAITTIIRDFFHPCLKPR
jgi:pimeloyl-ACP methyl ester carboxylesterase